MTETATQLSSCTSTPKGGRCTRLFENSRRPSHKALFAAWGVTQTFILGHVWQFSKHDWTGAFYSLLSWDAWRMRSCNRCIMHCWEGIWERKGLMRGSFKGSSGLVYIRTLICWWNSLTVMLQWRGPQVTQELCLERCLFQHHWRDWPQIF